jgi:hypothetical protein
VEFTRSTFALASGLFKVCLSLALGFGCCLGHGGGRHRYSLAIKPRTVFVLFTVVLKDTAS